MLFFIFFALFQSSAPIFFKLRQSIWIFEYRDLETRGAGRWRPSPASLLAETMQ